MKSCVRLLAALLPDPSAAAEVVVSDCKPSGNKSSGLNEPVVALCALTAIGKIARSNKKMITVATICWVVFAKFMSFYVICTIVVESSIHFLA